MFLAALDPRQSCGAPDRRALVPRWRAMLLVAVSASVCAVLVGFNVRPAFAIQAEPPADWSYYMNTNSTTTAYNLGCDQGTFDKNHGDINSEVVLDFGGQGSSDISTKMINGVWISNADIEAASVAFAHGYWVCTGSDLTSVLKLGVGTNNSAWDVSTSGGNAWANVVAAVKNTIHADGYDTQVIAGGASDIETWQLWNHPDTRAWIDGCAAINSGFYLNYGSADGCPTNISGNAYCSYGWYQYDYYWASWGSPPALPTPEIYSNTMAWQWAMISLYGAQYQGTRVWMEGPWDEYDLATNTLSPYWAWTDFWNALNANSQTAQNMSFALEIHWES
jgi:hypothetical protein